MALNSVVRITALGEAEGQLVVNVWWYRPIDPLLDITPSMVAGLVNNFWQPAGAPLPVLAVRQSIVLDWNLLKGEEIKTTTKVDAPPPTPDFVTLQIGAAAEEALVPAMSGTVAGEMLPLTAAITLGKRTTENNRRYRGHWNFGGIPESSTVGSFVTAAAQIDWNIVADRMETALVDDEPVPNGYQPCVFSRRSALDAPIGVPQPARLWTRQITTVIVRPVTGTQRSRKFRLG